jgi:prepilin-type N-terminal cleavage/methylation domain-containing protein
MKVKVNVKKSRRNFRHYLSSNKGFTLVEIMVATTISMLIIGSVYAVFKSSLNAYQKDETKILMLQKCRTTLDRITQDVNNMFYADGDEELTFMCEDYADSETSMDKDMVSFAAIVNPNLRDYVPQEEQMSNSTTSNSTTSNSTTSNSSSDTSEIENDLPSDLSRIVYFIGQDPESNDSSLSLMRVETSNLDTTELQDMLSQLQSSASTLSDEMLQVLKSSVLMDNIAGLNIRYFDGTDWVDTWDMETEETIPQALEITISITDPDNKGTPLTQAAVIYLNFSKPIDQQSSGQNAASQSQGNQTAPVQ